MLPEWLGELRYLESMVISECGSLRPAPSVQPLRALKELRIIQSGWVGDLCSPSLTNLQILGSSRDVHQLPECLGELGSLQMLRIKELPRLNSLPQSLGYLTSLQKLEIGYCDALGQIPDCVGELRSLRVFKILCLRSLTCDVPSPIIGAPHLPPGARNNRLPGTWPTARIAG